MARNDKRASRLAVVTGAVVAASALLLAPPSRADESHRSDRANEVHAEGDASPAAVAQPGAAPSPEPPAPTTAAAVQPAPHDDETPAQPAADAAAGADDAPAPGNAGTVKIHRTETADDDRRNEPHVCGFRIVGFGFPADADLEISIVGHGGPNAGTGTFAASVPSTALSPEGDWAVAGPVLADGMYKLAVENTTAPGGAKQKVFKVDCSEQAAASSGPGGSVMGAAVTRDAGGAAGAGTAEAAAAGVVFAAGSATDVLSASASTSPAASAAPGGAPAATEVAGAVLARTGTSIVALVLIGLCLLLGGEVLRRRSTRLA